MSRVPYSSVVGYLMYAMVCSQPDLSYAMSLASRYMDNPGKYIGRLFSGFQVSSWHF
jgi:ATP-binding cassette subfamily B (MDR/TAP) protein 1